MSSALKLDQYYLFTIIILCSGFFKNANSSNATDTISNSHNNTNNNNYVPIFSLNGNISRQISSPQQSLSLNPISANKPVTTNTRSSQVPSESNSSTYKVLELSRHLEARLKGIRNSELGVTVIQEMFDSMEFVPVPRNDVEMVKKMASKLGKKVDKAAQVVESIRRFILTTTAGKNLSLSTVIHPCLYEQAPELHYDKQQIEILNFIKTIENIKNDNLSLIFDNSLLEELKKSYQNSSNFKRQYFLSAADHAIDRNCQFYFNNPHLRLLYTSAIKNKHILILFDHGSSLNVDQLEMSKTMAKNVIELLNDGDMVNIISVTDKVTPFIYNYQPKCPSNETNKMYPATVDTKAKFMKFIDSLNKTKEATNHSLGFQYAFNFIKETNEGQDKNIPFVFLYISRGLLLPLAEAKNVLETIANGQKLLKTPVVINTCAIILDEKRIMYEKQFLRDITVQNYTNYGINTSSWLQLEDHKNLIGSMLTVSKNRFDEIHVNATALFSKLFGGYDLEENMQLNLPFVDSETKELIISMTQTCGNFGLFGVDLYLNDIAEDVMYYNKYPDSYAFLIDKTGTTITHPSYAGRTGNRECLFPTDIILLENESFTQQLKDRILKEMFGNETIVDSSRNESITYTWHHASTYYIVCVVTHVNMYNRPPVILNRVSGAHYYHHNEVSMTSNSVPDLIFHRLDLIAPSPPSTLCRHFKQIATLESGTLFLSASSFASPFIFTRNAKENNGEIAKHNIQSLMAYIKDKTNLLANPGLLPQIRNDISALTHIIAFLKKKHLDGGPLKKYIIRRYVTTINGVLQVYPGSLLDVNLEPTQRPWFIKAMTYPGKIVVTEPYLDAGGAGYIVTISHTIFEGRANALHNAARDVPIGVVSIDMTSGFYYKLLLESGNFCTEANIKCFMMEDKGYLIAHPSIMEPLTGGNNRRPLEHITHKESFVANDILNHKNLVQKKLCNIYPNRTIQRYYQFNVSLNEVLTNIVHGEKTKYQITVIPGTNVFVTLMNSSSDGGAFCPCSTVDRLCLNCNRMEQTECECPCECPLNFNETEIFCPDTATNDDSRASTLTTAICVPFLEEVNLVPTFNYAMDDIEMKSCVNINCELYNSQNDCLGVIGCEWCQVDVDGETVFNQPFCTSQSSCFNGVLGSITPYGDGQLGSTIVDPLIPPAYSAIGPVVGAIITLCLVVGFAMYCFRQNQDPGGAEHLYADSIADNNLDLPMSRLNFDDITHDDNDMGGNSSNQNLLPSAGNGILVPDISPYRAPSAYRRPNADSDHGYSTMTPHEDSENLCFTLADPLISQKRMSLSDSASINTSVSSPMNYNNHFIPMDKNDLKQTALPASPHHVLAPVTVHRHMEATS